MSYILVMSDKIINPFLCIIITVALVFILGATWCIIAENSDEWITTTARINKFDYYDSDDNSTPVNSTYIVNVTYTIQDIEYTKNLFVNYADPEYIPDNITTIMYKKSDPNIIKKYGNGSTMISYICSILGCTMLSFAGCISYVAY